jgi:hypothetical protein
MFTMCTRTEHCPWHRSAMCISRMKCAHRMCTRPALNPWALCTLCTPCTFPSNPICILAGTLEPNGQPAIPRTLKVRPPLLPPVERLPDLSRTHYPNAEEIAAIAQLRHLSIEGVSLAAAMGCLLIGRVHGHTVWIVTNASHRVAAARRLDGQLFTYDDVSTSKSHA